MMLPYLVTHEKIRCAMSTESFGVDFCTIHLIEDPRLFPHANMIFLPRRVSMSALELKSSPFALVIFEKL